MAVASEFARTGDLVSLRTLLLRCPFTLAPRLLDVLDCLPETLPPAQWTPLITQVSL